MKTFSNNFFNKRLLIVVQSLVAMLVCGPTSAKVYFAQVMGSGQTTLPFEVNFFNGVSINDSELVYFARINNIEGIYRFDAETRKISLLRAISRHLPSPWTGRYHAVGGGLALMSERGALYATDGTPSGTRLIREFGFYLDFVERNPFIRSKVKGIHEANGSFYFITLNEDLPDSSRYELWRTDGTATGTRKISSGHSQISHVFSASIGNEDVVLFITGSAASGMEIHKINRDESIDSLHNFEAGINISRLANSVRNRKGSYLCSQVRELGSPAATSRLWRISNSGSVTAIEEGCYANTLATNAGRIFYLNSQGLKSTDGTRGNARTEMAFSSVSNMLSIGFCSISDSIYYAIQGGRLIEVRAGSVRTINAVASPGDPEIELCSQSKIIVDFNSNSDSSPIYIFDTTNDSISNVRHLNSIIKSKTQLDGDQVIGTVENDRGELFSFGFISPDTPISFSRSALIRIALAPSLVPQIMLLLSDDEDNS